MRFVIEFRSAVEADQERVFDFLLDLFETIGQMVPKPAQPGGPNKLGRRPSVDGMNFGLAACAGAQISDAEPDIVPPVEVDQSHQAARTTARLTVGWNRCRAHSQGGQS
jgi:hypothetical protein